ncbi:MAG TPA: hypothetical protein VF661_16685 [Actinomycetales bacterium]|jgi:hypothetical protein
MTTTPEPAGQPLPMRRRNPPINPSVPPSRNSLVTLGIIVLGYVVSLAAPSLVVSPGQETATVAQVVTAFGLTLLGVAITLGAGMLAFRRDGNYGWLIVTFVPAVAIVGGGAILAGTKVLG